MGQFWFVSLSCDSIYIVTVDEKYQQVTSGDLLPPPFPPPQPQRLYPKVRSDYRTRFGLDYLDSESTSVNASGLDLTWIRLSKLTIKPSKYKG